MESFADWNESIGSCGWFAMGALQSAMQFYQRSCDLIAHPAIVRIGGKQLARRAWFFEGDDHREGGPVSLHQLALTNERVLITVDPHLQRFTAQPAAEFREQRPRAMSSPPPHRDERRNVDTSDAAFRKFRVAPPR